MANTASPRHVAAEPYGWPYNGALRPGNTALIVIDMQTDFCGTGGYVDVMGYDLSLVQAPIWRERQRLLAGRSDRSGRWPSRVWMMWKPSGRSAASVRAIGWIGACTSERS